MNAGVPEPDEELRAAQSGRDDALATLAHEFRNALAPIRTAVEIMRVIGHKDAALNTARDVIERQVERLSRLVDDHLDVARSAVPEPEATRLLSPGMPRRIVVIDDNADAAESVAMLLRLKGHEVHISYDGDAGVGAALKTSADCVIVDIGLPGIDGYEVARRLRSHDHDHRLMLIALTGYGQPEDIRRSAEAGFDHHLVKPVTQEVLESLIRHR